MPELMKQLALIYLRSAILSRVNKNSLISEAVLVLAIRKLERKQAASRGAGLPDAENGRPFKNQKRLCGALVLKMKDHWPS
jgi:hypothetical protein